MQELQFRIPFLLASTNLSASTDVAWYDVSQHLVPGVLTRRVHSSALPHMCTCYLVTVPSTKLIKFEPNLVVCQERSLQSST